MTTLQRQKLNLLYKSLGPGRPWSSHDLAQLSISKDLATYYVRAGWLKRLAHGVFSHPTEALALNPSLQLLQRQIPGLHVGSKTALDWHGLRHFVAQRSQLQLYGWNTTELPDWFTSHFPAEYHRKRLFDEAPGELLHAPAFTTEKSAPLVSAPERALLELLSEVGVRQPLAEARAIAESSYTFRADVLQDLLLHCSSIKSVRLCLQLGRELALPWSSKLEHTSLPTGSRRPWVMQSREGLLVLKP